MFKAYLKDRWWSLAGVAGMGMAWALARPPYWKIVVIAFLILFPLSYLGYVAWPKWRKPVTPRRRNSIILMGVGVSLLAIGERLEFLWHGSIGRGLGVGVTLLGGALGIVAAFRNSNDGPF